MKQRPDAAEVRPSFGPLFADPPHSRLFATNDPATSRAAAAKAIRAGIVRGDALYLLRLIVAAPDQTLVFHGQIAAAERAPMGADLQAEAFRWRIKLGRRTGTLFDAGLVYVSGQHGDFQRLSATPKGIEAVRS